MSIERGLLADIHEHPDEDSLRLILADWLQDQPDPLLQARSEFIRLQCQLRTEPRNETIRQRVADLESRYAQAWVGALPLYAQNILFYRGLVRLVLVGSRLTGASFQTLAALPEMQYVDGLVLREISPEALTTLMGLPILANQEVLVLHLTPSPASVWSALARSPYLGNLRHLRLQLNQLGEAGIQALASAVGLRKLVELNLNGNEINDRGLAHLARSPILGQVERLDLRNNNLRNAGVSLLAHSPHIGQLRWLNLQHNYIGDEGVIALATSSRLSQLTYLNLSANNGGAAGAQALINSSRLPALQQLIYDEESLDAAVADALRSRFPHRWGS